MTSVCRPPANCSSVSICGVSKFSSRILPYKISFRWKAERVQVTNSESAETKTKKANLYAERKQRITLPNYSDGHGKVYSFQEFVTHPLGIQSLLNLRALRGFESLDVNTYRCTLPKVQFLKFEVSPVLILRVTAARKYCTVEMLSCKFQGSKALESQNDHFTAFMRNQISWDIAGTEPTLDVDVKLNVTLEVRTPPFTLLPLSVVEIPGNIAMQRLVDNLLQLLVQHLVEDYDKWVQEQLSTSP